MHLMHYRKQSKYSQLVMENFALHQCNTDLYECRNWQLAWRTVYVRCLHSIKNKKGNIFKYEKSSVCGLLKRLFADAPSTHAHRKNRKKRYQKFMKPITETEKW